ncbi:histidine phosphatase superfamily [Massariosphaeria phaeospora]|uniref:Histidine phosphatase superfamily n=1 Tax=Massariosphaeria phaeospora TaxID=100035 RepID=A0A7C8I3G9_9PLEO|nr:histidine phosphatase superfamily [Massariosphaeria phaeospora]
MLALFLAVMAAAWLIEAADDMETYQVHAAVAFIRHGERTPLLSSDPAVLTPLGAQQMFTLGENLRSRYMVDEANGPDGLGVQHIAGMSPYVLNNNQLLIQTLDTPYLVSSAQALMQGLYPPFSVNTTRDGPVANLAGFFANGSAIQYPMGGYQYPNVQTVSALDPQSIYLAGDKRCPMSQQDSTKYFTTEHFSDTKEAKQSFYQSLDVDWFHGDIEKEQLDYLYALEVADYLTYANVHDSNATARLSNDSTFNGVHDQIQYLADEQAWYVWGNTSTSSSDSDLRAMAGKTLAALVLGQFKKVVANQGNTSNGGSEALTLLFGEHEPFISLLSLVMADRTTPGFRSIPQFGSAMIFELYTNSANKSWPSDTDSLWVSLRYHNGSDYSGSLQSYDMFNRPRSQMNMPWPEFQDMFSRIMVTVLSDWCEQCSSGAFFCRALDDSTLTISLADANSNQRGTVSPTIAGVIGAVVSLVVAGLLFAAAMLLGGMRVHRVVQRGKTSRLRGFKGSAKLASDADLNLAKNGVAPAGIAGFAPAKKSGHERIGSWELRQKEFGGKAGAEEQSPRESLEGIEAAMGRKVEPVERV